ncbi:MAG TPA: hypothetical protein VJH63_00160 [Candidatus Paceibacterota bacterium]
MKNHQKGFAGIAIIIILALGIAGFGAYKVYYKDVPAEESMNLSEGNFPVDYEPADHKDTSPTTGSSNTTVTTSSGQSISADTSNWKTYKNEKYGFEFGYSSDIRVAELPTGKNSSYLLNILIDKDEKVLSGAIQAYKNPESKEGIDFLRESVKKFYGIVDPNWPTQIPLTDAKVTESLITSKPAIMVIYSMVSESNQKYPSVLLYTLNKNYIFRISFTPWPNESASKILSTFKFTDPSLADTSNWKTYKNEKYGYSISYPSDWTADPETSSMYPPEVNNIPSIVSMVDKDKKHKIGILVYGNGKEGPLFIYDAPKKQEAVIAGSSQIAYIFPDGYEYCDPSLYDVPEGQIVAAKGDCSFFTIPIKFNNYWYRLGATGDAKEYSGIYKEIFSSFKFTK